MWQKMYHEKCEDMNLLMFHYGLLLGTIEVAYLCNKPLSTIDFVQHEANYKKAIDELRGKRI